MFENLEIGIVFPKDPSKPFTIKDLGEIVNDGFNVTRGNVIEGIPTLYLTKLTGAQA